jgi:hypothetical protein
VPARTAAGSGYPRFLAWAVGLTLTLVLVGYAPTRSLAGKGAIPALVVGCAIGLVSAALGGVPIHLARGSGRMGTAAFAGMAVRFASACALALGAVLSGWLDRGPLLVWVALSYLVLLVVDTRYALGRL